MISFRTRLELLLAEVVPVDRAFALNAALLKLPALRQAANERHLTTFED